jgi:polysaccharide biosynthesis/export protein
MAQINPLRILPYALSSMLLLGINPSAIAQTPPQPASAAVDPSYILGPGDQIEITVFGYEEYTGPQTVLPDGTFSLPVIGSIAAVGKTAIALDNELTNRLQEILVNPDVTVRLTTLRPVVINVAGEVQRPGPLELTTSDSRVITLSSALVQAGGVTRNADIREIVVRRALANGESAEVNVNLWDSIWSDDPEEELVLQPGDAILVPRLPEGETFDRRLLARSSLAPETIKVRVVGEVGEPGQIEVPPDASVSTAVVIAGGPTDDARMREVALLRLSEDGTTVETQELDLRDYNDNVQIQDGDVIIVPEIGAASFSRGLGRVLSPLGSVFSIFNIFNGLFE